MKTKYLLVLTLLLSVIAIGQLGCPQTTDQAEVIGVDFSFDPGNPPSTINEGGQFRVILNVVNYGKVPVRGGKIILEDGASPNWIGIDKDEAVFDVPAASEEAGQIFPGVSTVVFPASGKYYYDNLPSPQKALKIEARMEYSYTTDTSLEPYADKSKICVGKESSECTAPESRAVNTRTPLSVTKIVKDSMAGEDGGTGFSVNIHLKKLVDGTLSLTYNPDEQSENRVFIEDVRFANQPLRCDDIPNNILVIRNERVLRCTGIVSNVGELPTEGPLIVKIRYIVQTKEKFFIDVNLRATSTRI